MQSSNNWELSAFSAVKAFADVIFTVDNFFLTGSPGIPTQGRSTSLGLAA